MGRYYHLAASATVKPGRCAFTYRRVSVRAMDFSGVVSRMNVVISVLLQLAFEKANSYLETANVRIEFQDRPPAEALGIGFHHTEC